MDITAYLKRIHYHGSLEPNLQTLQALHEAHLLAVPFENLDIHLGRPIRLDDHALFTKIILQKRGGFCYELNGLFANLLRELGFVVTLLSAGVAHTTGNFGPEFDHLTLLIHLSEDWLADVGFGASFRKPLKMQGALEHIEGKQSYRLSQSNAHWVLEKRDSNGAWKPEYRFTLQPHKLFDFTARCHYQQTSPESHFTRQRICSLATSQGRITLSDQRLITTIDDERVERLLTEKEYHEVLAQQFGVVLT